MRSALSLLLILVLVSSCSLLNDSDDKNVPQLIPLEVGNSWVMDINLSNGGTLTVLTDTLTVLTDSLIGSDIWYQLRGQYPTTKDTFNGLYLNHKNGLYKYSGSEEVTDNTLLFKNTDEQGEVFVNETEYAKWVTKYNGELLDSKFGVPSKNYTAEYIHINDFRHSYTFDQAYEFQRVISPEVGFIKWEQTYFVILNDSTLTLRSRFSFTLREFIPAD